MGGKEQANCKIKTKGSFSRRTAAALLALLMVSAPAMKVQAETAWPDRCYVASEGACLMDASSGVMLFGQNENEAFYPASITKVMTALLVLENCDNLNETVTFSYDAVHIKEENSTIIGASEGDRLSVTDCLYSLLFQSANEVANALAEHVGAKFPDRKEKGESDADVFVKLMNEKAASLGCSSTHFNNPSGLTDEAHYTSPKDMCRIMAAAIENETFLEIESRTYWTHGPIRRYPDPEDPWNTVYPKHLMLKKNSRQYYPGTIAGKTGYTMSAGNTLVTACKRNDMVLVATVMNAHANHYNDTKRLFDFGFDNFQSLRISDYDKTTDLLKRDFSLGGIRLSEMKTLGIDENSRITLPKGGSYYETEKKLTVTPEGESAVEYTYGGRFAGKAAMRLKDPGDMERVRMAEKDPILQGAAKTAAPDLLPGKEAAGTETGEEKKREAGDEKEKGSTDGQADQLQTKENTSGQGGRRLLFIGGGVSVLAAALLFIISAKEKKEARERASRRRRRLNRTSDFTGSQTIAMDLMLEQRNRTRSRDNQKRQVSRTGAVKRDKEAVKTRNQDKYGHDKKRQK